MNSGVIILCDLLLIVLRLVFALFYFIHLVLYWIPWGFVLFCFFAVSICNFQVYFSETFFKWIISAQWDLLAHPSFHCF